MGNGLESRMHIPCRNVCFFTKQKCRCIIDELKKFPCSGNGMLFMSLRFKIKCHQNLIKYCNFFYFTFLVHGRLCSSSNKVFKLFGWHFVVNAKNIKGLTSSDFIEWRRPESWEQMALFFAFCPSFWIDCRRFLMGGHHGPATYPNLASHSNYVNYYI